MVLIDTSQGFISMDMEASTNRVTSITSTTIHTTMAIVGIVTLTIVRLWVGFTTTDKVYKIPKESEVSMSKRKQPRLGATAYTDEWFSQRQSMFGASEAAAVCGMSRWSQPLDVFARKQGSIKEAREQNKKKESLEFKKMHTDIMPGAFLDDFMQ